MSLKYTGYIETGKIFKRAIENGGIVDLRDMILEKFYETKSNNWVHNNFEFDGNDYFLAKRFTNTSQYAYDKFCAFLKNQPEFTNKDELKKHIVNIEDKTDRQMVVGLHSEYGITFDIDIKKIYDRFIKENPDIEKKMIEENAKNQDLWKFITMDTNLSALALENKDDFGIIARVNIYNIPEGQYVQPETISIIKDSEYYPMIKEHKLFDFYITKDDILNSDYSKFMQLPEEAFTPEGADNWHPIFIDRLDNIATSKFGVANMETISGGTLLWDIALDTSAKLIVDCTDEKCTDELKKIAQKRIDEKAIRNDFKKAINEVNKGSTLANKLDKNLTVLDVYRLAVIHQSATDNQKRKIEELLYECHRGTEASFLKQGRYDIYIPSVEPPTLDKEVEEEDIER